MAGQLGHLTQVLHSLRDLHRDWFLCIHADCTQYPFSCQAGNIAVGSISFQPNMLRWPVTWPACPEQVEQQRLWSSCASTANMWLGRPPAQEAAEQVRAWTSQPNLCAACIFSAGYWSRSQRTRFGLSFSGSTFFSPLCISKFWSFGVFLPFLLHQTLGDATMRSKVDNGHHQTWHTSRPSCIGSGRPHRKVELSDVSQGPSVVTWRRTSSIFLGDFHGVSITRFDWQRVSPEELDGADGTSLVRSGKLSRPKMVCSYSVLHYSFDLGNGFVDKWPNHGLRQALKSPHANHVLQKAGDEWAAGGSQYDMYAIVHVYNTWNMIPQYLYFRDICKIRWLDSDSFGPVLVTSSNT